MKKILHFEDEQILASMYKVVFEREGIDYKNYQSPPDNEKDLIDLVLDEKPDLIIMDIIMPKMDGYTATKILKLGLKTKKIPIIGLCNMGQREEIEKAINLGMVDYYVNAEFVPSKLAESIKEYLYDPENYKQRYPLMIKKYEEKKSKKYYKPEKRGTTCFFDDIVI